MADDLNDFMAHRHATAARPLLGVTVLVVEDSRFASEAMRLLCLRSGARIRRADCLKSAHKHLSTYRPGVVIVDVGLPDGSGADLIREIGAMKGPMPLVIATSGDAAAEAEAMAAGAHSFLPKPIESLSAFQQAILAGLPADMRPLGFYQLVDETVAPDPLALRDDLSHAAEVLAEAPSEATLDYVAQFLGGIARSAHDEDLAEAARAMASSTERSARDLARLTGIVQERLAAGAAF